VTLEDVQRIARTVFEPQRRTVGVLQPTAEAFCEESVLDEADA